MYLFVLLDINVFNTCLASSNELLHKKYEDLLVKAARNSMNRSNHKTECIMICDTVTMQVL
jgi:hypothetical protein